MTHLIVGIRGIKKELDDFITQLQGKYFKFKYRAKATDALQDTYVQCMVQPIQFFSIVFPKQCTDVALTTILGHEPPAPQHAWMEKFVWIIRKLLHLQPVPKFKTDQEMPIARNALQFIPIGIKEDELLMTDGVADPYVEGL